MAKNTGGSGFRGFVNFIAYISIICIGVALLVGKIGGDNLAMSFSKFAEILAYIVTGISAYCFAHSKHNLFVYIIWLIATILIIVMLVI